MQESECFTGGAALVISVGGLNWLPQRRCSDREIKRRGDELDWWMIPAGEDRCPVAGIPALDRGGSDAIESLRKINCRPHLASSCRLPKELFQPPTCVPPDPFVTWTEFTLRLPDVHTATQRDMTAKHPCKRFIVYCDDWTPVQRLSDVYSRLHPDCPFKGSMSVELKDAAVQWTPGPSSSPEEDHSDAGTPDNLNGRSHRGLLKSTQDYGRPGGSCGGVKLRKSVSFDDDVMVYLFDRESPTLELHSEPSCNLQGFTVKDNGLEWEDDFSALEKSRHLQCARPARRRSLPLPAPPPERCPPSQRCMFLTYVTEADLEL